MKKILFVFALMLGLGVASAQQTFYTNFPSFSNEEVQTIMKHIHFTWEEEFRQDMDRDRFFYEHSDIQVRYDLTYWLRAGVSYRLFFQDKGKGFVQGNMVIPALYVFSPTNIFPTDYGQFMLRSRVECTLKDSSARLAESESWANWLKYSAPIKFTRYQITPFIGDETFLDCRNSMSFVRNRYYGGFDFTVIPNRMVGSLFYYLQQDRPFGTKKWTDDNVLIAQLRFMF